MIEQNSKENRRKLSAWYWSQRCNFWITVGWIDEYLRPVRFELFMLIREVRGSMR